MVDIDHFKQTNDRYGHDAGDAVLRAVGGAIAGAVRLGDVPARYGGEEFAVLLRNPTERVAVEVAERVRTAVAGLDLRAAGPPSTTVSVGVAVQDGPDEPIADLLGAGRPCPLPGEARPGPRPGRGRLGARDRCPAPGDRPVGYAAAVAPPSPGSRTVPLTVLAALFVVTLALRPQLVGLGPLLPRVQVELGVSHGVAGLLTTIPVLCMGFFAPLGPFVASRFGPRRALAACVAGIVGFGLLRALVPGTAAVVATTVGLGLAMGTAGALMSIVVKDRAPTRPALATGVYAAGIVAGSLVAAAVAVPLAVALGGWRAAVGAFAIASIGSLVGWLVLLPADAPTRSDVPARTPALPWRSGSAWLLVAVFGIQSLLYYGTISWLPDVYIERGWTEASAGSLIAVMHLVGLVIGLAVPWAADRVGTRRGQMTRRGLGGAPRLPRRRPRPRRGLVVGRPRRLWARRDLPALPDPAGRHGPQPGARRCACRVHAPRRLHDLGLRAGRARGGP